MKNQFTRLLWVCCTYTIIFLSSNQIYGQCTAYVGCAADVNSTQYATVIADDPFCCNNYWDDICQTAYNNLSGPPNPISTCSASCVTNVACADNSSLEYDQVIIADPFCCNTEWDEFCQDAYDLLFGPTNPACLGCVSPGCAADPNSLEYDQTIISDPFCCHTEWDNICQDEYNLLGGQPNPNPVCTADCVTEIFCADITSLQYEEVILADSFCCNTEWDDICQDAYELLDGPTITACQNCIDPGCNVDINSFEYDQVIINDPFCCNTLWDGACVDAYAALFGGPSTDPDCCTADPGCSANANSLEYAMVIADDPFCCYDTWDGFCQEAYAFLGGQLNPDPGCECSADPGCDADVNSAQYVIVVGADPFCCNGAWDTACQDAYDNLGGLPNQTPDPSCCNIDPGCVADVTSSEYAVVVAADPFCCYTDWDQLCQTAYDNLGGLPSSEPGCGAALSGSVTWNVNCGDRATTVRFYNPGTNNLIATYNTTLAADGSFTIPTVDAGTYDIFVKVSGHLVKGFGNITISSGGNVLAVGNVIPGDVNNVDGINIDDLTILLNAFGSTQGDPNFNPLADLNCDDDVNIDDLTLLITNFGQSGDSPPLN